jgi:lipid-binding SYLF domain-containing protein
VGKCAGANDGPITPGNQRQSLGANKATVVGRLLDTFDKDASGVSALQHSRNIVLPATFRPAECPIGLALYRAVATAQTQAKREKSNMRISQFRTGLIGLIAIIGATVSSAAYADSGIIRFSVLKAGWFIGGSGGSGTLIFHGRRYPVSIGGLSAGLVFGASETHFVGTVSNIFSPWDVAGVYGAAGAGAALVFGASAIVLENEKGAVLSLSGRQVGLIANVDLSGMAISVR